MKTLLLLCLNFFKTGLFAVGGGLAALPFITDMSNAHPDWFTKADIANMVAVSESTPGPIGINMATYVGFHMFGVPGAILTTFSLILPEFLSGRGFPIPVQVLSIRNSDAAFTSNFSQAGINQTLHQLTMQVSVDVSILVLGRSESFTVSSQVVVAETIIVGQVPDTFFQTGGYNGS